MLAETVSYVLIKDSDGLAIWNLGKCQKGGPLYGPLRMGQYVDKFSIWLFKNSCFMHAATSVDYASVPFACLRTCQSTPRPAGRISWTPIGWVKKHTSSWKTLRRRERGRRRFCELGKRNISKWGMWNGSAGRIARKTHQEKNDNLMKMQQLRIHSLTCQSHTLGQSDCHNQLPVAVAYSALKEQ